MSGPAISVNPPKHANAQGGGHQAKTGVPSQPAGNGKTVSSTENGGKFAWLSAAWQTYVRQDTLDRVGYPVSGLFLIVAISVLYLSLDHLTWAIHEITARHGANTSTMQARLLAIAIDCGLVLSEIKLVIDFNKRGKGSRESWLTVLMTSVMSAGMNAWAFAYEVMTANPALDPFAFTALGGAGQAAPFFKFYACVGFGIFVPAATFLFLKQATQLWLADKTEEKKASGSQGSSAHSGNHGQPKGNGIPGKPQGGKQ